jgi:hypothetical protein
MVPTLDASGRAGKDNLRHCDLTSNQAAATISYDIRFAPHPVLPAPENSLELF